MKKSKEDLIKASEALHYEISMLNNCAEFYEQRKKELTQPRHSFLRNILIESFGVHLRNLIEFFGGKKRDYITYQYFLLENSNVTFPHNLEDKYNGKVNNLLSHLTFHRLTYGTEETDWRLGEITSEVNENFREFFKNADGNLICDKLKNYLKTETKETEDNFTCSTSDAVLPGITVTAYRGPTIFRRADKK